MESTVNVCYSQVFELVSQLPQHDIQKLLKQLQIKFEIPKKERMRTKERTSIQELILQSPTWTDEEYNDYMKVRKHINQSRLQ